MGSGVGIKLTKSENVSQMGFFSFLLSFEL